jgi:hypothetical protein
MTKAGRMNGGKKKLEWEQDQSVGTDGLRARDCIRYSKSSSKECCKG